MTPPTERPDDPPAKPPAEPPLLARMVALVALGAAVDLWLHHHFGVGLSVALLGGISTALAAGMGVLDWVVERSDKDNIFRSIRRLLRPIVSLPVLVGLYILAAILATTYASIIVVPESGAGPLTVTARAVDEPGYSVSGEQGDKDPLVRVPVRVTAFGRTFEVDATGYLPGRFEVRPFVGRKIQAARELTPLPTVLFRPPAIAIRSLAGGGSFEVWRGAEGAEALLVSSTGSASSFLVGLEQRVPPEWGNGWRLELEAIGLESADLSSLLGQWSSPQHLAVAESPLIPGDRLRAVVKTRAGVTKAEAVIILGEQRIKDVEMKVSK